MTALTLPCTLRELLHPPGGDPACNNASPLWAGVSLDAVITTWDPLAACLLARADGRGPSTQALRFVAAALGANLNSACLRDADLSDADLSCSDLRYASLGAIGVSR